MIPIKVDLIPKAKRPGYAMKPEYITIHQTGNTAKGANAAMHNKYVHSVAPNPSWTFTVDDHEAYQHLPLNENGWHAGDGTNGTGNRKSIGIEICVNKDGNLAKAEANAAWLVAKLIREVKTLKPFPACMKQHYDWSRKNCPRIIRGMAGGWDWFLGQVQEFLKAETVPEIPEPKATYVVKSGDTLSGIAAKHGVTYQQLVEWNKGEYPTLADNPGLIRVGWVLKVDEIQSIAPPEPELQIGVYPTTLKIFPDTIPNGKTSINLYGAENEVLSFQIALRSNIATTIPVTGEIFEQQYINTPNKAKWGFDQPKPCYPDAMLKVSTVTLTPDKTKALWVRAGEPVKIGDTEITVNVTRWPWSIPRKPSLKTSIGLGGAGFAKWHKTSLFSTDYWQHYKKYYDMLLDYRLSAYHLPFASINDPAAKEYMTDERVTTFRCEGLTSEIWPYIKATGKGWVYNFDEPTTIEDYDKIKENAAGYHQKYSGIKYGTPFYTGAAGENIYDYLNGAINLWIPQTDYYLATKYSAKSRQAEGDELWLYTSWAPRKGYCNLMINQLAIEHRLLFWQLFAEGVTGYLYWHSTMWDYVTDPWTDQATVKQSDPGIYGDGSLFYPLPSGPCPSIRLELMREGMQDYELLKKAETVLGRVETNEFVRRLTTALNAYKTDPELFEQVRIELGNRIAEELKVPPVVEPPEEPPSGPLPKVDKVIGIEVNGKMVSEVGYLINNATYVRAAYVIGLAGGQVTGHGDHIRIVTGKS